MIDSVTLELNGRKYEWTYDPKITSPEDCWSWSDVQTFMKPAATVITQLNRLFIDYIEEANELDVYENELPRLFAILKAMGVTEADLERPGFEFLLEATQPQRFQEKQFELSLPDAAHGPFNCKPLRDWLFDNNAIQVGIPKVVTVLGDGPFDNQEFIQFLAAQGVTHFPFPLGQLILGRQGWEETQVDALIEQHRGRNLRVYSQEMFTQMLFTGDDPFAASPMVLAAYRAGHPGLEFVSRGWRGWVSTLVPHEASPSASRSSTASGWQQESPLHAMGYKVGKQGISTHERRGILEDAFRNRLPDVGSRQYMLEWGEPGTPERLRKIANTLASHCRNMKKRSNCSDEAIRDWEADLDWLENTFYQGHFKFQWPDTVA